MTPERWGQLEKMYQAAQGLPPSEQTALLEGTDPELRAAVMSILAQEGAEENGDAPDEGGGFLNRPAWEGRESLLIPENPRGGETAVFVGKQLGPYQIEQEIGRGGMGTVYRATDTRLKRSVAIKISKFLYGKRLGREARAIASLNHPHICTLYDTGPDYIVMEMVEGETMAARLRKGAMPVRDVFRYGAQIADALAAAHDKGITHRDLKPANVMMTKNGVKVLDFGLAKSTTHDLTLTMAGAIMGTPAYMAPEQLKGVETDARTDIFALGLTLYEMATGKHAAPGETLVIDGLPDRFVHIVERCLEPEPENRWQSARDVKAELEWAATSAAALKRPSGTSRVWRAIAGVSILLLFTLALVHFREAAPREAVVRSTILPPDKTSFATEAGPMSLSPDGKKMVFAATGQAGTSQLWIRPLDSAIAQQLPGTNGGAFPFWSPDSLWVAFFADGKLNKVDTRGGSPVALAEVSASTGYGGSWSAKGEIVYAPAAFTPLRKVSQDGGKTRSALDHASGDGFPWFLPDGEHFLFAAWAGSGHLMIRVGSLSSTKSTAIGEADSNATYAAGRLLYFLKGTSLMAQPFDLNTLRVSGEGEPVAEGVERFIDVVTVGAFTASNSGLLAYRTGSADARKQLTWFDRTGKRMKTLGDPREFFSIELSPDGRTLAASAPDALGNYDLWLYDVAGGLPTRFTSDSGGEFYGVWSPDGRSMILNTTRKGHYDLFRAPTNRGGTEEALYMDETDKVPTSWSSDGKSILYFTGGGPRHEIFLLPLTPERLREPLKPKAFLKTGFNETFGQFSPDGRWVVYCSDLSGQNEIYVTSLSLPSERHQVSTNGGGRPRWRSDGKELYYVAPDGKLMAAETRLSETNVEAGPPHALLTITGAGPSSNNGYRYAISADGKRILASIPVGNVTIQPVTLVQNFTAALKK